MALNPVRPLYSASATATNGSDTITVTGGVNCSFLSSGSIVSLGTRQLTDAISGTAPDGSGNSTIKLRRPWADPTTTGPLLAFMSYEGLADAVVRLRQIIEASEGSLEGAFTYMGNWDATSGNFPPAPGDGLGSQMYRVSVAGTMGGRAYRVGEPLYYDQFTSQWRSFFELASAFSTGLLAGADAAAWRSALGVIGNTGIQYINGSVGIGAPSPSSISGYGALTIQGNTGSFTDYREGGSLNLRVGGDNESAFINGTRGVTRFLTNDIERMRIDAAGKITSPNGSAFVGTVSNSGQGAIIQRGSNANGEFVRFADGTQICTAYYTEFSDVNISEGALFRSDVREWTFPAAFISPPIAFGEFPSVGARFSQRTVSSTVIMYVWQGAASFTNDAPAGMTAIGRWY